MKLYYFIFAISVLCLTPDEIEAQRSGWNIDPTTQYHIQTDEGPERYFRYQTLNGQFRKEKRLEDGTVIGTEGWLDPIGYLRIKDYIADNKGYRILKSKKVFVGRNSPIEEAVAVSRRVPAQSGILAKPRRPPNPFRQPAIQDLSSNGIDSDPIKPYRRYNNPSSTEYPSYYSSTIPPITIEETYNEIPNKPSVTNYLTPSYQYQSAYNRRYRRPTSYSTPAIQVLPPTDNINNKFKDTIGINVDPISNYGLYRPETRHYRAAIASGKFNSTARQIRGRNKTNQPIVKSDSNNNNSNNKNNNSNNKNNNNNNRKANGDSPIYYIKPRARQARYSQAPSSINEELPEYDGTHTNADGFQYYLKTHYHEEEQKPDKSVGSWGYVDPLGIRRVVYYKADENGFVHKNNNRYVGFNSTPYDPLPPKST